MENNYGDLIRVDTNTHEIPHVLKRVPLGSDAASGGIDEATLQDLLFDFPQTLPIASIDPAYAGAVPICKELRLPAGSADALYSNQLGRLTLSEFKLWRNPQARREVIGQILDYAKDVASWGYEDLQRQISLATGKRGNVLYETVKSQYPHVDEAAFVDNVMRHLRRGELLLLIVGDGIREDAANIVDFVQRYSGLHFSLAMVEAAIYRDSGDGLIVQPRVLARTEIVQRYVVDGDLVRYISSPDAEEQEVLSDQEQENLRFWSVVLEGFSFSETSIEVPIPDKGSVLYVGVQNSGWGGWALCFDAFLNRRVGDFGCYLTVRRGQPRAVRIFESLAESLAELQEELGTELELWKNAKGRPRIGYRRHDGLGFLTKQEENEDYQRAASWLRERFNRLVSTLMPRLQVKLADEA